MIETNGNEEGGGRGVLYRSVQGRDKGKENHIFSRGYVGLQRGIWGILEEEGGRG